MNQLPLNKNELPLVREILTKYKQGYISGLIPGSNITMTPSGCRNKIISSTAEGGGGDNIYTADGTITDTLREVITDNTLYFGTSNKDKSITIGNTYEVLLPDGSVTTFPVDGITLLKSSYDIGNAEGHMAYFQTFKSDQRLCTQVGQLDVFQNSEIGFFIYHPLGTPSGTNSMMATMRFTNPTTETAAQLRLMQDLGFEIFPYDPDNPSLIISSDNLFRIYDTLGNVSFAAKKNGQIIVNASLEDLQYIYGIGNGGEVVKQEVNKIIGATGTATLLAGTVTVADARVKTGAKIFVSVNTPGGTQGFLSSPVSSIVDETSFVINSSSNTDTSTVNYWFVNP